MDLRTASYYEELKTANANIVHSLVMTGEAITFYPCLKINDAQAWIQCERGISRDVSFPLIEGNAEQVLDDASNIVITGRPRRPFLAMRMPWEK